MNNKIRIDHPCDENWNSMLPNRKGKFCESCNKTVVDFTKMKNEEIQRYFNENSNKGAICGYYKFNQAETDNNIRYTKLRNRINQIKIKPAKTVALFSLTFLFSFSSCIMGKRAEEIPAELIDNDSINETTIKDTIQMNDKKYDSLNSNLPKN